MNWNDECNQYLAAVETAKQQLPQKERENWDYWDWSFWIAEVFISSYIYGLLKSRPEIIPDFSNASDEIQWFINALNDEQRKWFALGIISQAKALPDVFFPALVQAAVHETDLSLHGYFVGVACRFGHHRVAKKLLEYVEHGTDLEQKLALYAIYWVIQYTDRAIEDGSQLLTVLETATSNPQYSDTVREYMQSYYAEVKRLIEKGNV